jgi:peptidoglycan/xylan/chitin deacetylase (PgdA/CDA1 family)
MNVLADHLVSGLDDALDALDQGDLRHRVVLTFDDGFSDVYERAWPILADRAIPFTLFLASAYVGGEMTWSGSTARVPGRGLSAPQLEELAASGLCTIGNHTHSHVPPDRLTESEIDRCTDTIQTLLGVTPRHFAFPWGVPVPRLDGALRMRFRSAATGRVGRNMPGCNYWRLRRVPVRATDPPSFFRAKLHGKLLPERTYAVLTSTAKFIKRRVGAS